MVDMLAGDYGCLFKCEPIDVSEIPGPVSDFQHYQSMSPIDGKDVESRIPRSMGHVDNGWEQYLSQDCSTVALSKRAGQGSPALIFFGYINRGREGSGSRYDIFLGTEEGCVSARSVIVGAGQNGSLCKNEKMVAFSKLLHNLRKELDDYPL